MEITFCTSIFCAYSPNTRHRTCPRNRHPNPQQRQRYKPVHLTLMGYLSNFEDGQSCPSSNVSTAPTVIYRITKPNRKHDCSAFLLQEDIHEKTRPPSARVTRCFNWRNWTPRANTGNCSLPSHVGEMDTPPFSPMGKARQSPQTKPERWMAAITRDTTISDPCRGTPKHLI
jgi:hypothetical protein